MAVERHLVVSCRASREHCMWDSLVSSRRYCLASIYPGKVVLTLFGGFHIPCPPRKLAFRRVSFVRLPKDRLQLRGHAHEVCQGICLHFSHHATAMDLIGVFRYS